MGNLTLFDALTIDVFVLAVCIAIAIREARSALHPAWMFIGLHAYIVTLRLLQLYTGSHPMKATFEWPVAVDEVIRAGIASDVGLLAIAAGWIAARSVRKRMQIKRPRVVSVSKFRIYFASAMAIVVGVFGALTVGRLEHALRNASWDTSGYLAATTSWPAWSVCLLHFLFGFPPALVAISTLVLVFVAITNASRFAVVISILFLTFTWLSRRPGQRLPLRLVVGIAVAWMAWLPMKPLTRMLNEGSRFEDALTVAVQDTYAQFGTEEGSIDAQFLDMAGATMTLADVHGGWYWGRTIAPLFVCPVPRVFWPEKPKINQYQWDIQVPSRNMADLGMTSGLVAEGYVNFGYAGIVLLCFGVSFAYALAYIRVAHSHSLSPGRLLYFFCLAAASQVYRDGLASAVWFPFVYAAPIGWMVVSHWIWKPGRRRFTFPVRKSVGESVAYVR